MSPPRPSVLRARMNPDQCKWSSGESGTGLPSPAAGRSGGLSSRPPQSARSGARPGSSRCLHRFGHQHCCPAVVEALVEKALVALMMLGTAVEGKLSCAWPPGRPSTPPCQKPLARHSRHGASVVAHVWAARGQAPSIARSRMRCTGRPARVGESLMHGGRQRGANSCRWRIWLVTRTAWMQWGGDG